MIITSLTTDLQANAVVTKKTMIGDAWEERGAGAKEGVGE